MSEKKRGYSAFCYIEAQEIDRHNLMKYILVSQKDKHAAYLVPTKKITFERHMHFYVPVAQGAADCV